ncbi:MAG TPA: site-2 protease family protein [Streptosporangiaceae bacterium]|jgi:Zn-dependent protease|nr:site-2 protease family protein [Streptosporangiaceae bacterium]
MTPGDQAGDQPGRRAGDQGEGQRPPRISAAGIIVARPFGIPVQISPYWFLIAGVFIVLYANDLAGTLAGGTRYVVAAVFVILLYISVLIHELSHSVVARGYGLPVRRILLYPLGGVSEIEVEPQTPGREFTVSGAGPLLSFVLAAIFFGLEHVVPGGSVVWIIIRQACWANIVVGVFNLLPGLPLDGGRMLRAIVWKASGRPAVATLAAAWVGRLIAVALIALPVGWTLAHHESLDVTNLIWLVAIAGFMWMGASQSIKATRVRERLPSVSARRLARKAIPIQADLPLSEAVRRAEEAGARALVVVDPENAPIAIVSESAVMATPPERRPWIESGTLARRLDPSLVLPADLSGMTLIDAVRKAPATEYLVVEPTGQVYGVLAATDLDGAFAGV